MASPRGRSSSETAQASPTPAPVGHAAETFWLEVWYRGRWWLWLLWPLSLLLQGVALLRRRYLQARAQPFAVPVVVVGNITLGGTGKTPMIIALVRYLQARGLRPGVISRGYGGSAPAYPYLVTAASPVHESGDEPLLIALETGCPVMVGANRTAATEQLIRDHQCDLVLSDDGMQHYKLARQWEICLLDGARLLGNRLCLPAGPLRESPSRLSQVDCVVLNGTPQPSARLNHLLALAPQPVHTMQLRPAHWCNVVTGERRALGELDFSRQAVVNAVSGIGNPERFFTTLRDLGIAVRGQAFPDHHAFTAEDLAYVGPKPLLMTAKDAVKCQSFAQPDWWYLSVEAELPTALLQQFTEFLHRSGLCLGTGDSTLPAELLAPPLKD